eukprot:c4462_g1_i1.p1 GENE.c4462_g1_i1~~c4462_g1_i1.p1  ORF type:complete len:188 (+),score=65.82 c4462_g1_i1:23-586(+)
MFIRLGEEQDLPRQSLDSQQNINQSPNQDTPIRRLGIFIPVILSFIGLVVSTYFTRNDGTIHFWVLIVNGFFWLWAVKNIIAGPLRRDGGAVSFLLGFIAGIIELVEGKITYSSCVLALVGAVIVVTNFLIPIAMIHKDPGIMVKRLKKTPEWVASFRVYCWLSVAFWSIGAALLASDIYIQIYLQE